MVTPVCVKCGREMRPERNGVIVYHPMEHATEEPVQEKIGGFTVVDTDRLIEGSWKEGDIDFVVCGDKYKCPNCGVEIVTGFGGLMMATAFSEFTQAKLKRIVNKAKKLGIAIEIRRK